MDPMHTLENAQISRAEHVSWISMCKIIKEEYHLTKEEFDKNRKVVNAISKWGIEHRKLMNHLVESGSITQEISERPMFEEVKE